MNYTFHILFLIASVGLTVSALIFLSIAIFCDTASKWILPVVLFCCVLSNLFHLIRSMLSKNQ